VSFGVQQWPHTDDTPVTKKLTYRNLGDKDVTLTLTSSATNPKGAAAPAGFFKLGADRVTVPAHGTAAVDLTADTRLGGTVDGAYSAYVTATGDGQSVRTAAAVQREVESYDLTIKHIGRDGKPTGNYYPDLIGYAGLGKGSSVLVRPSASGTTTVRLPKGTYLLNDWIAKDSVTFKGGLDWLLQPKLTITKNTTVTVDARKTKAADISVPDRGAKPLSAMIDYMYDPAGLGVGIGLDSFAGIRVGALGPEVSGLTQSWSGQWVKGAATEYDVATTAVVKQFKGGKVRHFKAGELATVKNTVGASAPGKTGGITTWGEFPNDMIFGVPVEQKLPGTRTQYLSTSDGIYWSFGAEQYGGHDKDGTPIAEAYYTLGDGQKLKAGKTYRNTVNTAVFGPHLSADYGLFRDGNLIYGALPLFADGRKHAGSSVFTSVNTTLYRNGTKVGSNDDPLTGEKTFQVPTGDAAYKLTTSVKRSAKVSQASTRIDAAWTFRSKKPANDFVRLPASVLHFGVTVGPDSRVPAGKKVTFPVTVEGAATGSNLKSLTVYISYDGKTFKKVDVRNGEITVKSPAKGKSISFRSKITDKKGNASEVSIYNAYYGK
jgi:hypothetical protein